MDDRFPYGENTMFESHPSPVGGETSICQCPFRRGPARNRLRCQKVSTLEDIRRATKARRRFILRRPLAYHAFLSETTVKTTGGGGGKPLALSVNLYGAISRVVSTDEFSILNVSLFEQYLTTERFIQEENLNKNKGFF